MKEILAESLQALFDNSDLTGTCTYKSELYEVWEVSDEDFDFMCNMTEENFEKLCPDGMWRYSEGSILSTPGVEYEINGHKIIAWDDRRNRYIEDCQVCPIREMYNCKQTEEDYNECFGLRRYRKLTEYFCEEVGVSLPRNVCALAMDLAKYNNMSLGELFRKYEG